MATSRKNWPVIIAMDAAGLALVVAISYGMARLGEPQAVWLWHLFGVR